MGWPSQLNDSDPTAPARGTVRYNPAYFMSPSGSRSDPAAWAHQRTILELSVAPRLDVFTTVRKLLDRLEAEGPLLDWTRLGWWDRRALAHGLGKLETILAERPDDLDALYLSGIALRRLQRIPEALERLAAVHVACPDDTQVAWEVGWAAVEADDVRFALAIVRSVQNDTRPDPHLAYLEGIGLLISGKVGAARRAFWSSFELGFNPTFAGAMVNLCDSITAGRSHPPRSIRDLVRPG